MFYREPTSGVHWLFHNLPPSHTHPEGWYQEGAVLFKSAWYGTLSRPFLHWTPYGSNPEKITSSLIWMSHKAANTSPSLCFNASVMNIKEARVGLQMLPSQPVRVSQSVLIIVGARLCSCVLLLLSGFYSIRTTSILLYRWSERQRIRHTPSRRN